MAMGEIAWGCFAAQREQALIKQNITRCFRYKKSSGLNYLHPQLARLSFQGA